MTVDQVRRLLAQGEGIQLEFKEADHALPDNFFETVCAFLNRDGGTILLGVEDDGTVCGVQPTAVQTIRTNIVNLSNNPEKLDPPCVLFPSQVQLAGKEVLCVQVLADSQLHRTRGVVYDRSEDGDFGVTDPARIAGLHNRKRLFYTESTVYPHLRLQDLREDLFPKVRQLMASRNPGHPWLTLDNHQLLVKAGLYQRDNQQQEGYTLAAALLFGRDEVITQVVPHFRVDALLRRHNVQRYDDRLDIRTNLIDAYEQLMEFVSKHLPDPFYMEGTTSISLRDKIFREVVANILVHREYTNALPTTFVIYADQVIAENANVPHHGGPLLLDTFAPYPKNPTIARFFLQLGRAEELGSGVMNVTHYLPKYVPGALPRFIDGPVFQTVLPLLVRLVGEEAAGLLLRVLALPPDATTQANLAALSLSPNLPTPSDDSPAALVYQQGLSWSEKGTKLNLDKKPLANPQPTFDQWQELSDEEKGTKLASPRLLQFLRVLTLCLQPQPLTAVLKVLDVANRTKFRTSYLEPLLQRRLLALTLPDIPNSPNQRYQTTEQGQLLVAGG